MKFFNTDFFSKHSRVLLWSVGAAIVAFLIFHAGVVVGSHQAMRAHSGTLGMEHGFRPPFGIPELPDGYMPRSHGVVGMITSVTLPTLLVQEPNGDVETVYLATTTLIDNSSYAASSSALTAGLRVVIFGDPDESVERINAKVIHLVMP